MKEKKIESSVREVESPLKEVNHMTIMKLKPSPYSNEPHERYSIKTHFVGVGENYIELVEKYVSPFVNKEADILYISEKIISLCQGRVVYKRDVKVGLLAKTLSKFVHKTTAGYSVGNVYKMQVAIDEAGVGRILLASFASAITKPFGKRGVFYSVAGNGVSGIDGFYGEVFDSYEDMGILDPQKPNEVSNEIYEKTGVRTVIVDANDLGVSILGKSEGVDEGNLKNFIRDNPATQGNSKTPFIIVRRLNNPNCTNT